MIKPRLILKKIELYFDSPEAIIITGMRRTGKTTILNFIYEQIESRNKIFLDLENPLNRKYFEEKNYERIKKTLEILGIDFTKRPFIFCDEIQFVRNLPSVVKYFIDHYNVKFFLTGSASFYLKNLFTESLAGRKFIFELFPLTFSEFLLFKGVNFKILEDAKDITPSAFESIAYLYDEYILFGGFPGVVLKTNIEEKKKALEEIFTSFFQLEVTQLGDFRKNEIIRDLILLLMQRIGSRLDIQKISKELKVSRPTLNEYVSFLESTYFIKTIKPYSRGKDTEIRKMPKVYLCDTGLANHFAKLDPGSIFENSVFLSLRLKGAVNYYQKKSGVEIDFILDKKKAYEVKLNPQESDLRKLKEIANELKLEDFAIVSKSYCELDKIVYGFML
ncbi:MAG: ATP-binding protein [Nitrospirae bacterium]|jgi:predicted AAA+ superfamily ATPase|nr:ATP-binding protein [Nitrospirota bacterium]